MPYAKSFSCMITVYPDFYKDPYADYLKEKINKWISECFTAYNSFFKIKVFQYAGTSVFYEYDTEKDKRDINFKKLWSNPYGSYTIFISAAGFLHNGISNSINPPIGIVDNLIDKISFKYQETSDISSPMIIYFGKKMGTPNKFCFDNTNAEEWDDGFGKEDVYCPNWKLSITCSENNFSKVKMLIDTIVNYNTNKYCNNDYNPYEKVITIDTSFLLEYKKKGEYIKALNALSDALIVDDTINILESSMNFISQKDSVFALESYIYDEIYGRFFVKNVKIEN